MYPTEFKFWIWAGLLHNAQVAENICMINHILLIQCVIFFQVRLGVPSYSLVAAKDFPVFLFLLNINIAIG